MAATPSSAISKPPMRACRRRSARSPTACRRFTAPAPTTMAAAAAKATAMSARWWPCIRWCASIPRPAGSICSSTPGTSSHIVGLKERESQALLDLFADEISRPEYQVRFHWSPHALVIWDNQAVAHAGPIDYAHFTAPRIVRRITVAGRSAARAGRLHLQAARRGAVRHHRLGRKAARPPAPACRTAIRPWVWVNNAFGRKYFTSLGTASIPAAAHGVT